MLENLMMAIAKIKGGEYKVTIAKNGKENIHQTQRNEIGAMLREALSLDLAEIFPITDACDQPIAYVTADGAILEIPNESVKDKVSNPDGSGAISVEFSVSVKSLDYNAANESDAYQVVRAEKAAKAQAKAEEKARKMARDAAARAKKKGEGQ